MFTLCDAEERFRTTLQDAAAQISTQLYCVLRETDAADVAVSLGGPEFRECCVTARLAAEYAYDLRKVALAARHGLVAVGMMTGEDEDTYRVAVNDCDLMLALMAKVRMLQDQREAIEF
jgi:hypothetical protein